MVADARARGGQDLPPASVRRWTICTASRCSRRTSISRSSRLRARRHADAHEAGTYSIICNEYCGINHHTMASRLYVVERNKGSDDGDQSQFPHLPDARACLFHEQAEKLIRWNAVAGVVSLLVGGILALLVMLTRWPAVHLLPRRLVLPCADRARARHAGVLDHLLRDRGAVLLRFDAVALPARRAALGLARLLPDGDRRADQQCRHLPRRLERDVRRRMRRWARTRRSTWD